MIGLENVLPSDSVDVAAAAGATAPAASVMDEPAFQAFYRRTAPPLRSYLRRSLGKIDVADDLLQEAYLRYLRTAPHELAEGQQRAYLYRIAGRLLVDHWRRLERQRRWNLWRPDVAQARAFGSSELGPDVAKAFRSLKPQQRSLLWLAYVEGFEHHEIAGILGLREKSVRVLLFRARKKLAALLKQMGFHPEGKP